MGGSNVVVILSMADMVIFLCSNCAAYELDLYNICLSNLCCKILLLLNMADMVVVHVKGCKVSSAEYSVHLTGVNRLSACTECGVVSAVVEVLQLAPYFNRTGMVDF